MLGRRAAAAVAIAVAAPVLLFGQEAPPDDDIRGLRGPVEIPEPTTHWGLYAAAVAALILLALAAWYSLARRRIRGPAATSIGAREAALAAIEAARALRDPATSRDFAYAVSDAVRGFLETRLGLPSTRQTTDEFLRAAAAGGAMPDHFRTSLSEFLEHCDRGKFGGWALDPAELAALESSARDVVTAEALVQRTQAEPAPPTSPPPLPQAPTSAVPPSPSPFPARTP